jgi:hypothetical protein
MMNLERPLRLCLLANPAPFPAEALFLPIDDTLCCCADHIGGAEHGYGKVKAQEHHQPNAFRLIRYRRDRAQASDACNAVRPKRSRMIGMIGWGASL